MSTPAGLYRKYTILKADGSPVSPDFQGFVLRLDKEAEPKHRAACIAALATYADEIEPHLPTLALDLRAKYELPWDGPNRRFPTCEAVGHCQRPTGDSGSGHHFYWDGERDGERMEKIHGEGGKGHDDPLAAYGAVICKTCGRRALVLQNAEDFPEI